MPSELIVVNRLQEDANKGCFDQLTTKRSNRSEKKMFVPSGKCDRLIKRLIDHYDSKDFKTYAKK